MPAVSRPQTADRFLEVFWELFRQGIITLGMNNANREFPFCRLSRLGKRLVDNQDTYYFHDVSTYSELLQKQIPSIHPVTLLYLKEALQSFRSGCILSSSVMLGVAAEHTFELLLDAVRQSSSAQRQNNASKMDLRFPSSRNSGETPSGPSGPVAHSAAGSRALALGWVLQCGARYGLAWPRSLRAYAFRRIGALPVSDVTTPMCWQS